MKVFLTGATGFIGGRLARRLREAGHEVTALVRSPEKAAPLKRLGIAIAQGDITDPESLTAPMRGAEAVFHAAAWYKVGVRDRSPAHRINVEGTRNVLEAALASGVRRAVYTSTLAVFSDTKGESVDESYVFKGSHLSEYDRTKWLAHYEAAEPLGRAGLPLTIVQPGVVYGPGDHSVTGETLRSYLRRRLPIAAKGSAYCWAHVDDVVDGHILALEKGRAGESYIIAGPAHTLIEALAVAESVTGIKAPRLKLGPGMLRFSAAVMTVLGRLIPLPVLYHGETLRVGAGVTYLGSNAKARRELGYRPRSLVEGFREVLPALMRELGITD